MMPVRVAVVGLGKIAHDQHLPAIAASPRFEFAAAVSMSGDIPGVPTFRSLDALLAAELGVDAIAMCQPPQPRAEAAARAIRAGKHVLLEKPPAATLSEVATLTRLAEEAGVTLFAAWHSRFAPAVAPARDWLRGRRVTAVAIAWKEDVRRWHPGQQWIWEPGGLGVFDPGINALSIATAILPEPLRLTGGTLSTPANRAAPIAAELDLALEGGAPVRASLDWRQQGPQTWDISVDTGGGSLHLRNGGAQLEVDGQAVPLPPEGEYPGVYARFAELLASGQSEVDAAPLRLVADAFMRCGHVPVEPFED